MTTNIGIEATLTEMRQRQSNSHRDSESLRILNKMREVQRHAGQETEMTRTLRDLRKHQNGEYEVFPGLLRRELDEIKENLSYAQVEADRKRRTQEMMDEAGERIRESVMESMKVRKVCCHQTCALPAIEYQDGKIIVFNEHRGQKHVNYIDIDWICEQAALDGKTDEIIERLRSAKIP